MRHVTEPRHIAAIDDAAAVLAELSDYAYEHGLFARFLLMFGTCASVAQILWNRIAICANRVNLPPILKREVVRIQRSNFKGDFVVPGALSRAIHPFAERRALGFPKYIVTSTKVALVPVVVKMNCAMGVLHGSSHQMRGRRSAKDTLRYPK